VSASVRDRDSESANVWGLARKLFRLIFIFIFIFIFVIAFSLS